MYCDKCLEILVLYFCWAPHCIQCHLTLLSSYPMKILIFSLVRHDDTYTSTIHQLARQFALEHEVIIVENPFTVKDLFTSPWKKTRLRLKGIFSKELLFFQKEGVQYLASPIVFPSSFLPHNFLYNWVNQLNTKIITTYISQFLVSHQWESFVFINSFNYYYPTLSQHLKKGMQKFVYHSVDPIVEGERKHGTPNESLLTAESDVIICTARSLFNKWRAQYDRVYFIPNASDYQHFASVQEDELQSHIAIQSLRKPVIGYFGNIERRIDFELVLQIAQQYPMASIVLAGPFSKAYIPTKVNESTNIHFTGPYLYDALPSMIKGVDLTMIPFKTDSHSADIYPLKFFEYLGSGKKIVTTRFNPDLINDVRDLVFVIDKDDLSNLDRALEEDENLKKAERMQFASQNTWEERARQFLKAIE